jgi:hypothetical protein
MIVVGGKQFKNKTELENDTRQKLKRLIGLKIDSTHEDFNYFLDLLNRHHEKEKKIGQGVSHFIAKKDQTNKKAIAMFVVRKDGSEIDFSWKSCCNQRWKSEKQSIKDAMRSAIEKTRPHFKNECELCKTKTGPFEAHHAEIDFDSIAERFIRDHPEILQAKLTEGTRTYFAHNEHELCDLWVDHHDTLVRWQYLCVACHNDQHKKIKRSTSMNQFNITIQAPELVEAMNRLTAALMNGQIQPAQVEELKDKLEAEAEVKAVEAPPAEPMKPKKAPKAEAKPAETVITLEDVRAKLATLAQAGKQNEVKELLASFGATKLTEVDPASFADLIAKADAL